MWSRLSSNCYEVLGPIPSAYPDRKQAKRKKKIMFLRVTSQEKEPDAQAVCRSLVEIRSYFEAQAGLEFTA